MIYDMIKDTKKYLDIDECCNELAKSKKDIYLFGGIIKGTHGPSLGFFARKELEKRKIEFKAYLAHQKFITDSTFKGKPVYALESHGIQNPQDVIVVIGIADYAFAKSELKKYGFQHFYYFDACGENVCAKFDINYIREHESKFDEVYHLLNDSLSKEVLLGYLKGKAFHNFSDLSKTYDNKVYFNDLYIAHSNPNGKDEVMIDCGAFDGDSTLEFIRKFPEYKRVYAFEPDSKNFMKLKENIKNHRVTAIQKGAYSSETILRFSGDGMLVGVDKHGEIEIPVTTIDSVVFNSNGGGG